MSRRLWVRTVEVTDFVEAWPTRVSQGADSAVPDLSFVLREIYEGPSATLDLTDILPGGPLVQDDVWFVDELAGFTHHLFSGRIKVPADNEHGAGGLEWTIQCSGYHEDLNVHIGYLYFPAAIVTVGGDSYDCRNDAGRIRYLFRLFLPSYDTTLLLGNGHVTHTTPRGYYKTNVAAVLRDLASDPGPNPLAPVPARAWVVRATLPGGVGKLISYYSRAAGAGTSMVKVSTRGPLAADEVLLVGAQRVMDTSRCFNVVVVKGPGGEVEAVGWDTARLVNARAEGSTLVKVDDAAWAGVTAWQNVVECAVSGSTITKSDPTTTTDATWTNLVNAAATGNDLQKTGTSGAWDAGGWAVAGVGSSGGWVTAQLPDLAEVAIGWSNVDTNQNWTSIVLGIRTSRLHEVNVIKSGAVWYPSLFVYEPGDEVRIDVYRDADGTEKVEISHRAGTGGEWTSRLVATVPGGTLTYPLHVDTSIATPNARLQDVHWLAHRTNAWDAGAFSLSAQVPTTGGSVRATLSVGTQKQEVAFGLSASDTTQNWTGIGFGVKTNRSGGADVLEVVQAGTILASFPYEDQDRVTVTVHLRPGGAYRAEVLRRPAGGEAEVSLYATDWPPLFSPLWVDVSIATRNARVGNIELQQHGHVNVWDAGGFSTQSIPDLGGYCEAVLPADKEVAFGFSSTDADANWTSIQIGVRALVAGQALQVIRNGVVVTMLEAWAGDDLLRIDLLRNTSNQDVVTVSRYRAAVWQQLWQQGYAVGTFTFPLYMDASLATRGARLGGGTIRNHAYATFSRADSIGAPWNLGVLWAGEIVADDTLDTQEKRRRRGESILDAHAYPRLTYVAETLARRNTGDRWSFLPGELLPIRDPARWGSPTNLLITRVTTDWARAVHPDWPLQTLECGDRLLESGEQPTYLLRTPGPDTQAPPPPTALAVAEQGRDAPGTTYARFTWGPVGDDVAWVLIRLTHGGRAEAPVRFPAGARTGTIFGLSALTDYAADAAAQDGPGNTSPYGPQITFTTPYPRPVPPTGLGLDLTQGGGLGYGWEGATCWIGLAWTHSPDAAEYRLTIYPVDQPERRETRALPRVTSTRVDGRLRNRRYVYSLVAVDVRGYSSRSATFEFAVPSAQPAAPTNFQLTRTDVGGDGRGQATFSWQHGTGGTGTRAGYRLYVTYTTPPPIERPPGQRTVDVPPGATNATIGGLELNTSYNVHIRAFTADGDIGPAAGPVVVLVRPVPTDRLGPFGLAPAPTGVGDLPAPEHWRRLAGTVIATGLVQSPNRHGPWSLKEPTGGTPARWQSRSLAVFDGQVWSWQLSFQGADGGSGFPTAIARVRFYGADEANETEVATAQVLISQVSAGAWTDLYGQFTIPSGVSCRRIQIELTGSGANGTLYWSLKVVQGAAITNDLADGAVTDAKVAASGITTATKLRPWTTDGQPRPICGPDGTERGHEYYSEAGNRLVYTALANIGLLTKDGYGNQTDLKNTGYVITAIGTGLTINAPATTIHSSVTARQVVATPTATNTELFQGNAPNGQNTNLVNLKVNGVSKLRVTKDGAVEADAELRLEAKDDQFGGAVLLLHNRDGSNGPVLRATPRSDGSYVALVDFGIEWPRSATTFGVTNWRVEDRAVYTFTGTAPEWQFGPAGNPYVAFSSAGFWVRNGPIRSLGAVRADTQFELNGTKVVGARGAAVADVASANAPAQGATYVQADVEAIRVLANETKAQLNALLARLRAATGHGLIS